MNINNTNKIRVYDRQYQLDFYRASSLGGGVTVRMDEQFTLLYGNNLYFKLHEYKSEELLGKDVTAIKIAEKHYYAKVECSKGMQSDHLLVKTRANLTQNTMESYIAEPINPKQMFQTLYDLIYREEENNYEC